MCNLKDNNLGVRTKLLQADEQANKILCNSAMLIKCLASDANAANAVHCILACKLKTSKYQVKQFRSVKPIDVVRSICNFSLEKIKNFFYIFENTTSSYKLNETSLVNNH